MSSGTNTSLPVRSKRTALVLAGGGAAGNAWAVAVVAGLHAEGIDTTTADLVVGTSSGATAAVQLTRGIDPEELYAALLEERIPASSSRPGSSVSGQGYLDWSDAVIAAAVDAPDMRRRMGAAALERAGDDGEGASRWRQVIRARLGDAVWPDRRVLITAVDARTGRPVVLDRDSGVDLVDAVAASTSAMTPYWIGEERYLNGGYRRNENADLAAGYERVLVLSPFGGRSRMPAAWRMDLATQVEELRATGSTVQAVFPSPDIQHLFDANALDPTTRLPAARGGFEQARRSAAALGGLWS